VLVLYFAVCIVGLRDVYGNDEFNRTNWNGPTKPLRRLVLTHYGVDRSVVEDPEVRVRCDEISDSSENDLAFDLRQLLMHVERCGL